MLEVANMVYSPHKFEFVSMFDDFVVSSILLKDGYHVSFFIS